MAKRQTESSPLSRFAVLVAQLESIVASAHQQPPDPLLCFDLLSALVATIEEESQESIVKWQRKCEDALFSLLVLGARRPVRHLASSAMVRVIAKGDGISVYSRTSSLQGWLADSKRSEPLSCAGVSQCLGQLYHYFGRRIISGLTETANIAAKLMKFHEDFIRQDALQMLENALEGSGPGGASAAYTESFRIIMRLGVSDKAFTVRLMAARCLKTYASIGGPNLGTTELENSMSHCIKALEDPVSSVRDAFAEALGALLALVMNPAGQVNARGKDHPGTAKKLDDILPKYLMSPFTRDSLFSGIHLKYHIPDNELQGYAVQAIDMLQGNASTDAHALLESAGHYPSAAIATLRTMSYLLTTLGEVPSEFKEIIDDTVVAALSHSSLHVRIEAALTMRALAEVDPYFCGWSYFLWCNNIICFEGKCYKWKGEPDK
ncbi:hypothetical protein HPP92_003552 [Vanilla planifolia]|uniref:ARM repeat superfamily protein n=1 Tax=Vanilla planifolia TaxID=51239 RepID=A0A835S375_VANPL|nr:hypothetical protein HPP92_003552 [Vanilla planifolia]